MAAVNTSTFHQIGVITRLTLREARRRSLLWIGLGLGLAFSALFGVGFFFAQREFNLAVEEFDAAAMGSITQDIFAGAFTTAGLYVINFLVVIIAVLTTVGAISAEIQTNTIHAIAVKPLRRWESVMGKWIGYAGMMTALTVLLVLGIIGPVWAISGYVPPNVLLVTAILVLESLSVMSVTLLGSTIVPTLANGVLVFMLYGLAFIGGWVEQLGALLGSSTAQDLGILSSLLLPSEALWRYAAGMLQENSVLGAFGPFTITSQPSDAFVFYSIVYVIVMLVLSMWAFSRRDF
ncbi:MAG: ABC transporter permease subunit [Anaerolineae bacterium]